MDNKIFEECKFAVNTPQSWKPLSNYLNAMLTEECNRLVMANDLSHIKEIQGAIKTIRRILDLPNEVSRREPR